VDTHTDVSFGAKHMMIRTVRRKFDRVEGLAFAGVMAA
jgi:polyisoprenoid-binding protein YceI